MEGDIFRSLAERVVAASPRPLTFSAAASHVASTLRHFPDGVTEPILLCALPKAEATKHPSLVDLIYETRHIGSRTLVDLVVKNVVNPRMFELGADGSKIVLHAPGGRLRNGPPLNVQGRRVRLVRTGLTETALGDGAPPPLLLPTPHTVVYLDAERDRELLSKAACRIRGQQPYVVPLVLLRVARVHPVREYVPDSGPRAQQKCLRRLMLAADGDTSGEIEAELILWDEQSALLELLPPDALLALYDVELFTPGDAAVGGLPAQLGLLDERSLICVVDEATAQKRSGAPALPESDILARPAKLARVDHDEADQPSGPPLLATPPAAAEPNHWGAPSPTEASVVVGRLVEWPAITCAEGGSQLLRLRLESAAGVMIVELFDCGGANSASRIASSLRPGHHIFVDHLTARPSSPDSLVTEALPPPPPVAPAPLPPAAAGGASANFNLDDELSDEALLALDLDFLDQRQQPPPPQPPPQSVQAPLLATWTWNGILQGGGGSSRLTNLSTVRAALRSPQLQLVTASPLNELLSAGADVARTSGTCLARMGACAREMAGAWRLTLVDAQGAKLDCEASDEVADEVLEMSAIELERLVPCAQHERAQRACEEAQPRMWALTRESSGSVWRANACA